MARPKTADAATSNPVTRTRLEGPCAPHADGAATVRAVSRKGGRSPLALFATAVAFLLPVAYSTSLLGVVWTLRATLALIVATVGAGPLVLLAWRGPSPTRRTARLAAGFVGAAAVAAILSSDRIVGFFGLYDWGTGWFFVLALAGAWAIGACLASRDAHRVANALLLGGLVRAAIALAEVVFDLGSSGLGLYQSRAPGLLGNPIQLGTLLAACIALAASRVKERSWMSGLAIVALAAALEVSGSRIGTGVVLAIVVALVIQRAGRAAAIVAASVILGFGLGAALGHFGDGGGATATSRVQQSTTASGLLGGRPATWWSARHAIAHRPLVGAGPGEFRAATSEYRPLSVARTEGFDLLFADAHNLFVEYAVTTGLIGVLLLLGWLLFAVESASGPLIWFALAGLACHMVEPQYAGTTPLVFLALGAATSRWTVESGP